MYFIGPGPPPVGGLPPHTHQPLMGLGHGPSLLSLPQHGVPSTMPHPPPTLCNPCSNTQNFNSVPFPGPSRWGPRTSCPVHSPFRVRVPNGNVCSGHQVNFQRYTQKLKIYQYFICWIIKKRSINYTNHKCTATQLTNMIYWLVSWLFCAHVWLPISLHQINVIGAY